MIRLARSVSAGTVPHHRVWGRSKTSPSNGSVVTPRPASPRQSSVVGSKSETRLNKIKQNKVKRSQDVVGFAECNSTKVF